MAPRKPKSRRDNPVTSYLPPDLKRRVQRLAESQPRLTVSGIIEESLRREVASLEKEYKEARP